MPARLLHWTLMTPDDLDAAIAHLPLALVPCGSLEWHGPHLAAGCDYLRGEAICTAVAERLDGGVVLPPLYTTAPGFCNWRGSISFTPGLVKQIAGELYRSLRSADSGMSSCTWRTRARCRAKASANPPRSSCGTRR
jgi:creatinine amidohydrolase/Fe(II)-dependent formamide hydrolase-like protein